MAVNSVLNGSTPKATTPTSASQLDMTQFLKLLTAQLSHQDPLAPMSDTEFFAQLAQMGTVQGMDDLKKSANVTQATALLGKTVTAARPADTGVLTGSGTITGPVVRMQVRNGAYVLGVKDTDGGIVDIPLGSLQEVKG